MEIRPAPLGAGRGAGVRRARLPAGRRGEGARPSRIELAEGLPPTITTDEQRLQQVLKNLLSNAFKFTERGLACTLRHRPADGRRADRLLGGRHRHGDPAGQAADHLRGLPAGRGRDEPKARRHRPGPVDLARDRPAAGRRAATCRARRARAASSRSTCRVTTRRWTSRPTAPASEASSRPSSSAEANGQRPGARRRSGQSSTGRSLDPARWTTTARRSSPATGWCWWCRPTKSHTSGRGRGRPRAGRQGARRHARRGRSGARPRVHPRRDRAHGRRPTTNGGPGAGPPQAPPRDAPHPRVRGGRGRRGARRCMAAGAGGPHRARRPRREALDEALGELEEHGRAQGARLLVVEDDDVAAVERSSSCIGASTTRWRSPPSGTGEEALAELEEEPLRLHGARPEAAEDGRLRAAREDPADDARFRDLPVIVYTGKELTQRRRRSCVSTPSRSS